MQIHLKTQTAVVMSLFWIASIVHAAQYELSSRPETIRWQNIPWDGMHSFSSVLCLKFPNPDKAVNLTQDLYNHNAIYRTVVGYSDNVEATVISSTRPPGLSDLEEVNAMERNERYAEKMYGVDYHINKEQSAWGPVLRLRINNVAGGSKEGPFPLVRPLYKLDGKDVRTMSVHRLFARGTNRFEVAVIGLASKPYSNKTEEDLVNKLTQRADGMVHSLQECTSKKMAGK